MTLLEQYLRDNPNTTAESAIKFICPKDGRLECLEYVQGKCEECWNRKIPEETTRVCDCYDPEYERCNGTKERDKCSCSGNESQCDFYPEKRGETEKKTIYAHMPPFDTVEDSVSEATKEELLRDAPKILDSGNRREFETGAVRDIQEGKGRCDLMPLDVVGDIMKDAIIGYIAKFQIDGDVDELYNALDAYREFIICEFSYAHMFLEVSKHFEEGAKKYGEYNWQKGIPTNCYIDSAVRHYLKFLRGDTDEPHYRAFVWNLLCCIWTCKHKPELNVYRKEETC